MKGCASARAVTLAVLAWQVFATHGSALRARQQSEVDNKVLREAGGISVNHSSLRTAMLRAVPPFEMDAGSFISLVAAVPTDVLLLFFSPTCPDCERLAPQWSRVTALFENSEDLTILSVSDDAGKAPAPYMHDENPAIFFIPKGQVHSPVTFPMSYIHEFTGLPETGNTDDSIVKRILSFTNDHLTSPPAAGTTATVAQPPAVYETPVDDPAPPAVALSESQSGALTARLLASLKAKEMYPLEDQLKIVYEPHYSSLPVVDFLKSPSGMLGPPLVTVAATYLDGLPLAEQWANQYAAQQMATYRKSGWAPTTAEETSYRQDLLNYARPMYARSIYVQRGLRG